MGGAWGAAGFVILRNVVTCGEYTSARACSLRTCFYGVCIWAREDFCFVKCRILRIVGEVRSPTIIGALAELLLMIPRLEAAARQGRRRKASFWVAEGLLWYGRSRRGGMFFFLVAVLVSPRRRHGRSAAAHYGCCGGVLLLLVVRLGTRGARGYGRKGRPAVLFFIVTCVTISGGIFFVFGILLGVTSI